VGGDKATSHEAPEKTQVDIESGGKRWSGFIASIGILADGNGLFPVLIEVQNPAQDLLCGVQVNVLFQEPRP
jgi:hypothetical protein